MNNSEIQKLHETIESLKRENSRLHKSVKDKNYGLVWMDVPEAFEKESENKLPILKEVKEKAIVNDDGKPTHILIEGENYHALTCLNYTHKEKIDIIYIDPPYNTGNDGFKYKDKRFLTKYPDGTDVPKDSPFRHSYWLSFMSKRLELAKNLLKDTGVIFISIDDNEVAQLKLLCDSIFGEVNFVGQWHWFKSATPPNLSHKIKKNIEYVIGYEKQKNNTKYRGIKKVSKSDDPITKPQNTVKILTFPPQTINFKVPDITVKTGIYGTKTFPNRLLNELTVENGKNKNEVSFENRFVWTQGKLDEELKNKTLINCSKSLVISYKKGNYAEEVPPNLIDESVGVETTEEAGKRLLEMFNEKVFDYPKPVSLISYILNFKKEQKQDSVILDFFAGTGTTAQSVLELNKEDGGNRQYIICTNNENEICEKVTYIRNEKIINGYTKPNKEKIKGFGNSLKYYKAAFIGENDIANSNDEDTAKLAHHAGELLALAENTLYEVEQTEYFQIFKSNEKYTAIYFREEFSEFEQFASKVEELQMPVSIYVFSWGNQSEFEAEFEHIGNAIVKSIPQPILEIYKSIYNLISQ